MRTTNRKSVATLLPAVAVAAFIMAAGVAGNVIGTYVNGAPQLGHIIAFEPSPAGKAETGTRLVVHRDDDSSCVLDTGIMRRFGGSLVVESLVSGDTSGFRVHWAGNHTSNDNSDCGGDAMLIVGRQYLDVLASSAGGYGAGPDRMAVLVTGVTK